MEDSEGPRGEKLWCLPAYEQRGIHLNRKTGVVDRPMRRARCIQSRIFRRFPRRELHFSRPFPVRDQRR